MSTQLKPTQAEQKFLNTITSSLKEDYDRDLVLMGLRTLEKVYREQASTQVQRTGQSDWSVDQHWTDDQLK
jgi:hypothetical protein